MKCLLRRLRTDAGFTVPEMLVVVALSSILLLALSNFLVNSMNTSAFTSGQSVTVNDTRNTMQQIEKEIRGADSLNMTQCGTAVGSCLQMDAQTPTSSTRTIKYTYASSKLSRQVWNSSTSTWGTAQTIIDRVANTSSQPVFTCDTSSTLVKMTVDLHIQPTPNSDPTYDAQTSVRPRNYSSTVCS